MHLLFQHGSNVPRRGVAVETQEAEMVGCSVPGFVGVMDWARDNTEGGPNPDSKTKPGP